MPCRATVSWGQGGAACSLGGWSKGVNVSSSLRYTHTCNEYIRGPSGWAGLVTGDKSGHMPLRALWPLGQDSKAPTFPRACRGSLGPERAQEAQGLCHALRCSTRRLGGPFHCLPPALLLTLVSATESHAALPESLKWPGKMICAHSAGHEGPAHGTHLQPAPGLPCSPPAASRPHLTPASPPVL